MPSNAVPPANADSAGIQKFVPLIWSFFRVGYIEIAQLAELDRVLLINLAIALISSLLNFKNMSSQMFLPVLASVWLIEAINGTLDVNFRYQLPVIPFACWAITFNFSRFHLWGRIERAS
jgi:hypothetical protein